MDDVKGPTGRIFNIQKYSIHDGHGIRTLIFLKGCPLRCKWCSNPEGLSRQFQIMFRKDQCSGCGACASACPQKIHDIVREAEAMVHRVDRSIPCTGCGECVRSCVNAAVSVAGRDVSVEEIIKIIKQDSVFYWSSGGGVTFGGGEATAQSEFLIAALKECKKLGIHTALETCGLTDSSVMEELVKHVDLFLYDIKHIDTGKHTFCTGHGNERMLGNLEWLLQSGAHVIVRMPLIKGYNDSQSDLGDSMDYIKKIGRGHNLDGVEVLPYHKLGINKYEQLDKVYPISEDLAYSDTELGEIEEFFTQFQLPVSVVRH